MNKQEQLFSAMEKIARSVTEQQSFSKTVKGIVISETVGSDGAYDIEYLGGQIKAYPQTTAMKYKAGEHVLILLPNGQLNEKKTILGTAENRPDHAPDLDSTIQDAVDSIVTTGKNYIKTPKETITLGKNGSSYPITIEEIFYRHYSSSQSHIRLRAQITSNFTPGSLPSGFSYGIRITIQYEDKTTANFDFSYLNMEGNVYELNGNTQDLIFEIPTGSKPVLATGVLYINNPSSNPDDYVSFSNLRLELLSDILADIISSKRYSVKIYSDSGSVFDHEETKTIKLICQIISDSGIDVDPNGLSFDYEWYAISFDKDGNKIKPAEPTHTGREFLINLGELSTGTKFYECEVYPKTFTKIKKLDLE